MIPKPRLVSQDAHKAIYATDYPCPCGGGSVTVYDGTLFATRTRDEEEMPQAITPCSTCGNDDAEAIADAITDALAAEEAETDA